MHKLLGIPFKFSGILLLVVPVPILLKWYIFVFRPASLTQIVGRRTANWSSILKVVFVSEVDNLALRTLCISTQWGGFKKFFLDIHCHRMSAKFSQCEWYSCVLRACIEWVTKWQIASDDIAFLECYIIQGMEKVSISIAIKMIVSGVQNLSPLFWCNFIK